MENNQVYANELYQKKNIIGYTGDIKNNPTVYFKMEYGNRSHVGHITQDHRIKSNIGRETVLSGKNYKISNKTGAAIESIDGIAYHQSRNKFNFVLQNDQRTLNELAKAIEKFPKMKNLHQSKVQRITHIVNFKTKNDYKKLDGISKAMGQFIKDEITMERSRATHKNTSEKVSSNHVPYQQPSFKETRASPQNQVKNSKASQQPKTKTRANQLLANLNRVNQQMGHTIETMSEKPNVYSSFKAPLNSKNTKPLASESPKSARIKMSNNDRVLKM